MAKVTLITRINPKTGETERPWQDEGGNYILADPSAGPDRHTREKAVLRTVYDQVVYLVREKGHAIRMKGKGTPPSLISPASLNFHEVEAGVPASVLIRTAPLQRGDLHKDLAQMVIAHAATIARWANPAAATAFIGFPPDEPSMPYDETRWTDVDLDHFESKRLFDVAYDYAFQVGDPTRYGPDEWADLSFLLDSYVTGYIMMHSPMADPQSVIRQVGDMAHARWLLDNEPVENLSTRHLALLAQMEESAVRNALAKMGRSARGGIDNAAAREWLNGRRGFVPTEC
jgi:hypothetical protein